MTWSTIQPFILPALVFIAMLAGWVGLVIPIYPGLTIIWLTALIYAIIDGFTFPAWLFLVLITILMIAGNLADNFFISAKARQSGASWLSIAIGYMVGIIGTLVFPLVGGLLGSILGVLAVEFLRKKDWKIAWVTTRAMAFGFGWTILVRIALGAIMILLWFGWILIK